MTDDDLNKAISHVLRDMREDAQMTQRELSALTGVNQKVIAKYEAGINRAPLAFVARAAMAFECTVDTIVLKAASFAS